MLISLAQDGRGTNETAERGWLVKKHILGGGGKFHFVKDYKGKSEKFHFFGFLMIFQK